MSERDLLPNRFPSDEDGLRRLAEAVNELLLESRSAAPFIVLATTTTTEVLDGRITTASVPVAILNGSGPDTILPIFAVSEGKVVFSHSSHGSARTYRLTIG